MTNRVLAHTGAKYPIVQAPMGWIARTQLASAVSRAGGLEDGDVLKIGRFRVEYLRANELTDEGRTAAMPLEGSNLHLGSKSASLKVLTGSSAGLELPVAKAVSTFGKRGVSLVAIAHRRNGYFVSCLEAQVAPILNGLRVPDDPVMLSHGDVLELAGTTLEFLLT